jgi:hypothetical protein
MEIENIAILLKKDFPGYHFHIYRGLFGKYIAVEKNGQITFTIWIDKNSGYKELLDEVDFMTIDRLKRIFKSHLFHWTRYRNQWRKDYTNVILENLELSLRERQLLRKGLESTLQNIHIA